MVEPSDKELLQVAIDTRLYRFQATAGDPVQYELTEAQITAFARAVLARWGAADKEAAEQALRPIPVSERLPEPDDCVGAGDCWWYSSFMSVWIIGDVEYGKRHRFRYWLPAHALPLPEVE